MNYLIITNKRENKYKAHYSSHYKNNTIGLLAFDGDTRDRLDLEAILTTFDVNI
jgi:hypothetical protein